MGKTLHISVVDKIATYRARDGFIVCGNKGYQVKFTFDPEWNDYPVKTARFVYKDSQTDVVLTGDTCDVPMMRGVKLLEVGVFAGDLATTTPALIPCLESIRCKGGAPAAPSPDVYDQIMEQFNAKLITQVTPDFANNLDECTDTTKLYVLPDGYLYAYMLSTVYPEITVSEKRGIWYSNKGVSAWHVTGTEDPSTKETDYIPVTEGDQLQITVRGSDGWTSNGQWYDADKNPLEIIQGGTSNKESTFDITAPAGAKYVRIFSFDYNKVGDFSKVPFAVEWLSCAGATSVKWTNTGHAFVPADYEDRIVDLESRADEVEESISNLTEKTEALENKISNAGGSATTATAVSPLRGKKIVYDGDSICSSWGIETNGGAYPQIIADIVGGYFDNQGIGGGRFVTAGSGESFHSIVDNLPNLPTDGDLYCFEGGVNDQWHHVTLGDFNPTEYDEADLNLDKSTFCGAFETVLRYAINTFVGKAICVIIVHKCPTSAYTKNNKGNTFADFREKMIGLCEKYAIPYYDAFKESGLNSWNANHLANYFLIDEDTGKGDGTHPNAEGYKRFYVPQLIALFERILPPAEVENLLALYGYEENMVVDDGTGELMSYTGRDVTGIIPCRFNETFKLEGFTMPDDSSNYQNKISYYNEDGTFSTQWNLVSAEGGAPDLAAAVYEGGNLVQFRAPVNGYFRIGCVDINANSVIKKVK